MKAFVWGLAVLGLLSGLGALLRPLLLTSSCRGGNTRNAYSTLRTLVSAQADFREHDRDGDGRREYWRADVAGLYALVPPGDVEMIRLIEISTAGADLQPAPGREPGTPGPGLIDSTFYSIQAPKAGHWFAALPFEDEKDTRDPKRFAFCAVPDSLSAGKTVYAVAQDGVVWQRPARWGRDLPACFPLAPAAEGWRKSE
jgi:hypothetical protein